MKAYAILALGLISTTSYAGLVLEKEIQAEYCDPRNLPAFDDIEELGTFMKEGIDKDLPQFKQEFCKGNPRNIADRILGNSSDLKSGKSVTRMGETLAFVNPPGPVNGGMCWLHTRLQRQFTYLANYEPKAKRPTHEEAMEIIDRIVQRKGVTVIPGFNDLYDFSAKYEKELTKAIDVMGWKCVANPNDCLSRVADSYVNTPAELKSTMDTFYSRTLNNPGAIHSIKTRVIGESIKYSSPLSAHSLNILAMEPIRGKSNIIGAPGPIEGYKMRIIDPNLQHKVETVTYKHNDTTLKAGGLTILPYTHYAVDGDIPLMTGQIDDYCKVKSPLDGRVKIQK
ncbi:MAG TPA: hypothetical protein VNJ08_01265 [Bacteriovoracaceae bacterium]|nr:hypothetical protein [Bacteriovoracaceae bacterium]